MEGRGEGNLGLSIVGASPLSPRFEPPPRKLGVIHPNSFEAAST